MWLYYQLCQRIFLNWINYCFSNHCFFDLLCSALLWNNFTDLKIKVHESLYSFFSSPSSKELIASSCADWCKVVVDIYKSLKQLTLYKTSQRNFSEKKTLGSVVKLFHIDDGSYFALKILDTTGLPFFALLFLWSSRTFHHLGSYYFYILKHTFSLEIGKHVLIF